MHDIVFATKLLTHLLHQHAVVPTSTKAMTSSSRHSDHKQNGYDSSAETTLGDYEGKSNDDSSTEHSTNLLPTTPKKLNSSTAKRNIGKTNEVHESILSTSMKSTLSMPPALNRNLVTEKPILTVSKILSPATETLNELSSIDAASASNLRFDFSQLSQLTYDEIDTSKNDNVISLEVNKTNNDNNVASSNDGETKRSSFHILDKTSATMKSTMKEKTPMNTSMKQDHLHSFSNNSPKPKCDKNEIDKATELRMKKIQTSVNVSSSLKYVCVISFSFSTHDIYYYTFWIYFLLSTRNSKYIWECIKKRRR